MTYEATVAARYRARAEELRTIADCDELEETRQILNRVAAGYEKLARTMEELDSIHTTGHMPDC
jgi:hypothetical protein